MFHNYSGMPNTQTITKELKDFPGGRKAQLMINMKGTEFFAVFTNLTTDNLYVFSY